MAESHRVILSEAALRDLEGIAAYIRQHSPQNAATVAETILDAIDSLAFMPRRYRQTGLSRRRRTPVYAMVVRPFIVYYRVDDSPPAVQILQVRHGSRMQPRHFE